MKSETEWTKEGREWLGRFQAAVREKDYATGRALCHDDIFSYGTVALEAVGLDELEAHQWRSIWDHTEDFTFLAESVRIWEDQSQAGLTIASQWSSVGILSDGSKFARTGRSTLVLRKHEEDWLAVHTHFSAAPVTDVSKSFE